MINQTTRYAIRAIIELAQLPPGSMVLSKDLAQSLDIPAHYLGKILQQLVRARVLRSIRGRKGGFALAIPAEKIRLRDIIEPLEDVERKKECILGQEECNDKVACPLHEFWKEVRARYVKELEHKTVATLAEFGQRRKAVGLTARDFSAKK